MTEEKAHICQWNFFLHSCPCDVQLTAKLMRLDKCGSMPRYVMESFWFHKKAVTNEKKKHWSKYRIREHMALAHRTLPFFSQVSCHKKLLRRIVLHRNFSLYKRQQSMAVQVSETKIQLYKLVTNKAKWNISIGRKIWLKWSRYKTYYFSIELALAIWRSRIGVLIHTTAKK